jgi:muconolactone delta-isomerase
VPVFSRPPAMATCRTQTLRHASTPRKLTARLKVKLEPSISQERRHRQGSYRRLQRRPGCWLQQGLLEATDKARLEGAAAKSKAWDGGRFAGITEAASLKGIYTKAYVEQRIAEIKTSADAQFFDFKYAANARMRLLSLKTRSAVSRLAVGGYQGS